MENIRRYYQSIIGYEQAHSQPVNSEGIRLVDDWQTITPAEQEGNANNTVSDTAEQTLDEVLDKTKANKSVSR